MAETAAAFVSHYPPWILVVVILISIIGAFATETIVPGKRLKEKLDIIEKRLDHIVEILLLRDKDN